MTQIKPFSAVFYNQENIKNLAKIVCPPYDVISSKQQDMYHEMSEFNFVHIDLGKEKPTDDRSENRYTRSKTLFNQWLKDRILVQDSAPCIYYYKQEYKVMGERHSRLGFIALMRIPDDAESTIFPHENTHSQAKEDRHRLNMALNSQLSSIFVCFSDQKKQVENIFHKNVNAQKSFIDVVDEDRVRHVVWRLEDPKLIKIVSDALAGQQLFIADGHHRYEVAKDIRRYKLSRMEKTTGDEPFNFVMTYFTNMDSRELKIFPIHRVIKKFAVEQEFLEEHFRIDRLRSKTKFLVDLAKSGQNENALGLYMHDSIQLLRLKNKRLIDKFVKQGSDAYRRLDANVLKCFILDRADVRSEDIVYTPDANESMALVDEGRADAAFIMNPVKIQQLKEIALNGERMPPKTTYFYPKVLSGLTVYRME